ncbi:MAG: GDSL-type esterase/lipase family protein [Myxococcota bacterium]
MDATNNRTTGSWRLNLGLAVGGVAAGLALAFVVFGPDNDPVPNLDGAYHGIYQRSDDPILQSELRPGANGFVNADGFIGRDYAVTKPNGTFRIVGLGDSVTMYYSIERLNYLSLLEESLPARTGTPVEVLNFGVASYETPQMVRQLETKGLKYTPDFVLLGYCINDGTDFVQLAARLAGPAAREGRPSDDNLETHLHIRRAAARQRLSWHDLFRDHIAPRRKWTESLEAFRGLQALSVEHGFGVLVVIFPALLELDDYYLAPLHEALGAELEGLGFGVVDLRAPFRDAAPSEALRTNPRDAIHPNSRGYEVAADHVEEWLSEHRPWASRP